MTISAVAVGEEILRLGRFAGRRHNGIEVAKLAIIANGWHLANTGEPLFSEPVEAWEHGPNIESLYRAVKPYGSKAIPGGPLGPTRLPQAQAAHVAAVYGSYGHLGQHRLQALTSARDTPWDVAWTASELPCEIPRAAIREHYVTLRADRRKAAA